MKLKHADIYYPTTRKEGPVKYLTICSHPDDNEIMAYEAIKRGYRSRKYSFACVVATNGTHCPKSGMYETYTDKGMEITRRKEAKKAAEIGRYNSVYFLKYESEEMKDVENNDIINDIAEIIKELHPRVIYTHSLIDKHPTNVSTAIKVIYAIRSLPKSLQPKQVFGCEEYGDLDWVKGKRKVAFNISKNEKLQRSLINVYKSQIESKDFVRSSIGRRLSNATFDNYSTPDKRKMLSYALDLTPLIRKSDASIKKYVLSLALDLYEDLSDSMDISL